MTKKTDQPVFARLTLDYPANQSAAWALGIARPQAQASDGKADAYVRDLVAAVRELELPKLPKEGVGLADWLRHACWRADSDKLSDAKARGRAVEANAWHGAVCEALDLTPPEVKPPHKVAFHPKIGHNPKSVTKAIKDALAEAAATKPEDGAEFWRTGLREAALTLTGQHLNVVTATGFAREIYEAGKMAGEDKPTSLIERLAAEARSLGMTALPTDPNDLRAWLRFNLAVTAERDNREAEAFERGRVAGLRAAVRIEKSMATFACFAPTHTNGAWLMLRRDGWGVSDDKSGPVRKFPNEEAAQAAADAAPNWWEAGQ